jgi:hypothetical protein
MEGLMCDKAPLVLIAVILTGADTYSQSSNGSMILAEGFATSTK